MPGIGIIQAFRQLQVELNPTACSAEFDLASGRLYFGGGSGCVASVCFLVLTHWRKGVRPSAGDRFLTMSCVCLDGRALGRVMLRVGCTAPLQKGQPDRKDFQEFGLQGWPAKHFQPGSSSQHSLRTGFHWGLVFSPSVSHKSPQIQAPWCTWHIGALLPSVIRKPTHTLCRLVTLLQRANPTQLPPLCRQTSYPAVRQGGFCGPWREERIFPLHICVIRVHLGEERGSQRRAVVVWPPTAISLFFLVKGSLIFTIFTFFFFFL